MNINHDKYTGTNGTYVSITPTQESKRALADLIERHHPGIFDLSKFVYQAHMTIVYSREYVMKLDPFIDGVQQVDFMHGLPIKFEFWDGHDGDGYMVLKLVSKDATQLNKLAISAGAKHSFDDYTPHITIQDKLNHAKNFNKSIVDEMNEHINQYASLLEFNKIIIDDIRK